MLRQAQHDIEILMTQIFSYSQLLEKLPKEVKIIFNIFEDKIRLVGGSVRDLLLEKNVGDFDFATEFLPEDVTKILEKNNITALPTGLKHGTVSALINHQTFEITTLRKDAETFGRHARVEFVDDYFLDAKRRDFTINALYLDNQGLVYDFFDGISDLKNEKVKFIGDASERIKEDFLRILRFFRFSCNYARELDLQGLEACAALKENLKFLAKERITNEILKIFATEKKDNLVKILQALIDKKIFFDDLRINELQKLLKLEEAFNIKTSNQLRFFVALNKTKNWPEIFAQFSFSNKQKDYFRFLAKTEFSSLNKLLAFYDKNLVFDLYLTSAMPKIEIINFIKNFTLPQFPLNGNDFMAMGLRDKQIGEAVNRTKTFWANNDFKPGKQELLAFLKN